MFNKLVSNLPYNPSLINQVSFYAKRLHEEAILRRLGLIFVSLAMLVQLFAAIFPAQKSLASSPNDIVSGLSNNRSSVLAAWDNNTGNVRAIYRKFGITRDNLANMSSTASSTIKSNGSDYWSIGRLPLSNFGVSGSQWGERTVNAEGNIVYQRPLRAWDSSSAGTSYSAFKGTNQYGKTFWILKDCGNLTFVGAYTPSPPTPKFELHKSLITANKVKPGDTVKFRIEYRNTVEDSMVNNFKVTDTISSNFEFVSLGGMTSRSGNTLTIAKSSIAYYPTYTAQILTVKVKSGVKAGTLICNQATASSSNAGSKTSEKPCVTVISTSSPNPPPPTTPTPTPKPSPPPSTKTPPPPPSNPTASGYCVSSFLSSSTTTSAVIKTEVFTDGSTKLTGYTYDIGNNGSTDAKVTTSDKTYTKTITGLKAGEPTTIGVRAQLVNGSAKSETANCPVDVTADEEPRLVQTKSVKNITTGVKNADGTSVKIGDTLEFSLVTENVTSTDYKNYKGKDYFGDVLEYADILDKDELKKQGLVLSSDNYIKWASPVIKGNSQEVKTITVKIKDIVPSTNQPNQASTSYDCKISNVYGNEVLINVNCPLVKNIEQVTKQLPNTGPGAGAVITVLLAMFVGYFFMRARLMSRELELVKQEYTAGGF